MTKKEIIKKIHENNPWEFNHLKTAEELSELLEVILKKITKRGSDHEPPDQEIVDEIGDVIIRLKVLKNYYPGVKTRITNKLTQINDKLAVDDWVGKI